MAAALRIPARRVAASLRPRRFGGPVATGLAQLLRHGPATPPACCSQRRVVLLTLSQRAFCTDAKKEAGKSSKEGEPEGESTSKAQEGEPESSLGAGAAISLTGLAGLGLSMVVQSPLGRVVLRILGPGGMLFGVAVSVYELGGWKAVLSIPLAIGGTMALSSFSDGKAERRLQDGVLHEISEACPEVEAGLATEAMRASKGQEYETNRYKLDLMWTDAGGAKRRVEVLATRPMGWSSWTVTLLRVSQGTEERSSNGEPPAQTRFWDATSRPTGWKTTWERC